MSSEPLVRNVSDTARWVAVFRAKESARPDAVFRDPLARRLAGERGEQIFSAIGFAEKSSWSFVTRTYLFDRFIAAEVQHGADLAAGLDARPYRMALPASLQWIEVDLPEILDYKEEILKDEKPVCSLQRIRLDLSDAEKRRSLFQQLSGKARRAVVITEGLLTYLTEDEVGAFARDLSAARNFQRWVLDLPSPGLLRMLQKKMGSHLQQAPLKFGPAEGPGFFSKFGWDPIDVQSMLKNAASIKRLSPLFRLMALLPDSKGVQGSRPWSGVCLFQSKVVT
jgi:methyltransferase (TIGR00027 family)